MFWVVSVHHLVEKWKALHIEFQIPSISDFFVPVFPIISLFNQLCVVRPTYHTDKLIKHEFFSEVLCGSSSEGPHQCVV